MNNQIVNIDIDIEIDIDNREDDGYVDDDDWTTIRMMRLRLAGSGADGDGSSSSSRVTDLLPYPSLQRSSNRHFEHFECVDVCDQFITFVSAAIAATTSTTPSSPFLRTCCSGRGVCVNTNLLSVSRTRELRTQFLGSATQQQHQHQDEEENKEECCVCYHPTAYVTNTCRHPLCPTCLATISATVTLTTACPICRSVPLLHVVHHNN